ncbi:potassium channel family protein [Chloroflexota bacterium]
MRVLIMGCGRVGALLANVLDAEGHEVTVMDTNSRSFGRLNPTFKGNALLGDGTDEDSLRKAGIEEMDAFLALTQGDNRNIMAAQIAKHIFGVYRVICRVYDPLRNELYQSLGLDAVSPTTVFSQLLEGKLSKKIEEI